MLLLQISLPSPQRPNLQSKGICKNPALMKPPKALISPFSQGKGYSAINNGYHKSYPSLNGEGLFQGEMLKSPKQRKGAAAWPSLTYGYIVI